jgi:hypothetical protein
MLAQDSKSFGMAKIGARASHVLDRRNTFFAALTFACGANGLAPKVLNSLVYGADPPSSVIFLGLALCCLSLLRAEPLPLRRSDVALGVMALPLLLWPQSDPGWLAMTLVAIYLLTIGSDDPRLRAGAFIALALTVQPLWGRFIPAYFSGPLERIDISGLALLLGRDYAGNHMTFAQGSGAVVIAWQCTSFANASLALLLWVAIMRSVRPVPKPREWMNLLGVFASVFTINTIRLAIMAQSISMYHLAHGPVGAFWANLTMLLATVGWCAFGLRHELTR